LIIAWHKKNHTIKKRRTQTSKAKGRTGRGIQIPCHKSPNSKKKKEGRGAGGPQGLDEKISVEIGKRRNGLVKGEKKNPLTAVPGTYFRWSRKKISLVVAGGILQCVSSRTRTEGAWDTIPPRVLMYIPSLRSYTVVVWGHRGGVGGRFGRHFTSTQNTCLLEPLYPKGVG